MVTPKKTLSKRPRGSVRGQVRKTKVAARAHRKSVQKTTVAAPPPSTKVRTYIVAVGRRKSAIARVRFSETGSDLFLINGHDARSYFPTFEMQKIIYDPLTLAAPIKGDISVKVGGGGKHGQAEAIRLGISRVFVKIKPDLRSSLKRAGFLTRDPRVKERKKYGLKRARRAPQWQKR